MKNSKLSTAKRFTEILMLFAGFFMDFTLLKIKKRLVPNRITAGSYQAVYSAQAKRFGKKANQLGGLLIKLGQFVSVHVDVLPEEYTKELAKLQDAADAADFVDIAEIVAAELGETGLEIEEAPLASASLGQVHKGKLPSGEIVAVKVLKPNLDRLVGTDLLALSWVITAASRLTSWGKKYDLQAMYAEFQQTTTRELDLHQEGISAERIAADLTEFENVLVPQIYRDYSSKRVLTMQFMDGVKITNQAVLSSWGVNGSDLSQRLFKVFWHQVMATGFFHADPHPGNILVNQYGQLILLDFGMVSRITAQQKQQFFQLMTALMTGDGGKFALYIDQLGFVREEVSREALNGAMECMLAAAKDMGNGDQMNEELRQFLYSQPFQLPANVLFLGKTFSTLMGVCYGLDKKFDFMGQVTASLGVSAGNGKGFNFNQLPATISGVLARLNELYHLPQRLDAVAADVKRYANSHSEQLKRVQGLLYSTIWAVLTVGSGLIAAVIYVADKPGAKIAWAVALLFGGALFVSLAGSRQSNKRTSRPRHAKRPRARRGKGTTPPPGFDKPKFHP